MLFTHSLDSIRLASAICSCFVSTHDATLVHETYSGYFKYKFNLQHV